MAKRVPTDEIDASVVESRRMLDQIAYHHDAAERHADRGAELERAGDMEGARREYARADEQNAQANRWVDELQAKVGPNHHVMGDGTIRVNELAPESAGFDVDRVRTEEQITASTGLDPTDVALAGSDATREAVDVIEQQEAEQARAGAGDIIDGLLRDEGIDPESATREDIESVIAKEELRQQGVLDLIRDRGGDPDSMSPEELQEAAADAVAAREEELRDSVPETDDPSTPPDDAVLDDAHQGPATPPDDNSFLSGIFGGDRPEQSGGVQDGASGGAPSGGQGDAGGSAIVGGERPDTGGQGGGSGSGGGPGGSATGPGQPGSGTTPGGDDDEDDGGGSGSSPSGAPDDPGTDGGGEPGSRGGGSSGGTEPSGDGGGLGPALLEVVTDLKDADGNIIGEDTVTIHQNSDGELVALDSSGNQVAIPDALRDELQTRVDNASGSNESQPIDEGIAVPNLHADDPVVAAMIQQEHDAKAQADIDYGDDPSALDDMQYADIRPDQIDYGGPMAGGPGGEPDGGVEAPDAGVIDPSPLDDATASGSGPETDHPTDQLARDQAAGGGGTDHGPDDGAGSPPSEGELEFGVGADQPSAVAASPADDPAAPDDGAATTDEPGETAVARGSDGSEPSPDDPTHPGPDDPASPVPPVADERDVIDEPVAPADHDRVDAGGDDIVD